MLDILQACVAECIVDFFLDKISIVDQFQRSAASLEFQNNIVVIAQKWNFLLNVGV